MLEEEIGVIDIAETYEQYIQSFQDNDLIYYEKYLSMCARGNLHIFDTFNQVLLYKEKPEGSELHTYDYWRSHGRIPRKNTGICILDNHNRGIYVFEKQ